MIELSMGALSVTAITSALCRPIVNNCRASYAIWGRNDKFGNEICCSKVNLSRVNGNVIMSECGDDNPDE